MSLPEFIIKKKLWEWFDEDPRFRPNEVKIQFFCDYNLAAKELLVVQGAWSPMDGD
jgi:hypothetical protein